MFAVLWAPDFRLQAALRWREESGAIALVDGDATKGVLLEVNAVAAASRVQPGLTPAQALARCPELRILSRARAQEAACGALLAEIAFGFSPHVEATAGGVCTLDLRDIAKGACWQRLGGEIVARCAEARIETRVGIAPHPDHAWLACRVVTGTGGVNVIYEGAPFCAALPIAVLEPSRELAAVLNDWGICTIGEFLKLPAEGVIERLGPEAVRLRRRASGRSRRVLRLVRPEPEYAEAFDFDYAVETTEPLLFLLRRFVDALSARLAAVHRVATALTLILPLDGAPDYARRFAVPSPTADADVWFRVLSTHLESLTLEHQPVGVRLQVEAGEAAGRQLNLFERALRDPNRFGETLAQLAALVGERSVGVPQPADTHRPGAFVMEEFAEAEEGVAIGRRKGLPLRRWRSPHPVAVKLARERPAWIERFGPVTRLTGPYRLSGEWWERPWWTEEWDVELEDGACLRLARDARGRWNVEGAYDVC